MDTRQIGYMSSAVEVERATFDNAVKDAKHVHTTRIVDPAFTSFWLNDPNSEEPIGTIKHPWDERTESARYYLRP